jgi:hypothetical protein
MKSRFDEKALHWKKFWITRNKIEIGSVLFNGIRKSWLSAMTLSIMTLSIKHEKDCHWREKEQGGMGQNGTKNIINGTGLFFKIPLISIHGNGWYHF